jgi:hypothetical protein
MESRKEERQEIVRLERDAQGAHHSEEKRDFSHEREEVPPAAETPVSLIQRTRLYYYSSVHCLQKWKKKNK